VNGIHYLPERESTLAERFQSQGYETFAAVSSYVVTQKFGLAQGFDRYDDSLGTAGLFVAFEAEITADRVVDKFTHWLAGRSPEPFFAWLHFYDPHLPYEPPAEQIERAGGDLYRGEIGFVDAQLGRVRDELERRGLAEQTVVILTSDHGEAFGEHVEEGHGLLAYDETLKVPLIVHAPGRLPSDRAVATRVRLADLMPSIEELYGLPLSDGLDGKSFVSLLAGEEGTDRQVYFEALAGQRLKGWAPLTGLLDGQFKLIASPQAELFDVVSDPGETENRIEQEHASYRDLDAQLRRILLAARTGSPERELSSEDRRQLTALGYLGSAGETGSGVLLDPKQGIVIDMAIRRGRTLLQQGDLDGARRELAVAKSVVPGADVSDFYVLRHEIENAAGNRQLAVAALREVNKRFPALEHLRFQLATYLFAGDEIGEAEEIAKDLLAANPRASQAYNLLAAAARRRGDPEGALAHFRRGLAIEPESIPLKLEIVDLLVETKDFESAMELYDDLISHGVLDDDAERLFEAAMLQGRSGNLEAAASLFRRGLAISPEPVHHLSLALILAQLGRADEAILEIEAAMKGELSGEQRALGEALLAQLGR
jgi:tetratricopeptide (TPR) repeat protein